MFDLKFFFFLVKLKGWKNGCWFRNRAVSGCFSRSCQTTFVWVLFAGFAISRGVGGTFRTAMSLVSTHNHTLNLNKWHSLKNFQYLFFRCWLVCKAKMFQAALGGNLQLVSPSYGLRIVSQMRRSYHFVQLWDGLLYWVVQTSAQNFEI